MKTSAFQLMSERLVTVAYQINDSYQKKDQVRLTFNADVLRLDTPEDNTKGIRVVFSVFRDEPLSEVPFKIDVVVEGIFRWEPEANDLADTLLAQNAPAVLMSYVRPILSQLTCFSGLPPLIIPLIDFTK